MNSNRLFDQIKVSMLTLLQRFQIYFVLILVPNKIRVLIALPFLILNLCIKAIPSNQ